jgi:L-threonylcarbamoyladenylate synthase
VAGSLAIRRAGVLIREGGVVAYPTEAVWGLGCDPLAAAAVLRILELKDRPMSMGLVLIAADASQLEPWIEPLEPEVEARLAASWPGPVSWVVPAQPWVPEWLHGGRGTLAVRVTAHAQSAALCRAADMAIVSTSANRSGRPPARTAAQVRRWFGRGIDLILGGATGGRVRPSEIRDALTGRAVRAA